MTCQQFPDSAEFLVNPVEISTNEISRVEVLETRSHLISKRAMVAAISVPEDEGGRDENDPQTANIKRG